MSDKGWRQRESDRSERDTAYQRHPEDVSVIFIRQRHLFATTLATGDTSTAARVPTTTPMGAYELAIPSVEGKSTKPPHNPANVPTVAAIGKPSQFPFDTVVDRPVISATSTTGSHADKPSPGSMMVGHQHRAEPVIVRTIKSAFLFINAAQRKDIRGWW